MEEDVSHAQNHFLLSTSQDKTVRLFHPSRAECLCTFKHASTVHSLAFHPRDDRFFLAGAKDAKLRLWSVPDKRVEYSANVADVITAVAFSPDGRTAMAGTVAGTIACYATEQRFRPAGSFVARGKKRCRVSAIESVALHGADRDGDCRLLVTTADSAVRIFDLKTKALVRKLKGHRNEELTMRASMAPDARHVVVASEDRAAYVWTLSDDADPEHASSQHAEPRRREQRRRLNDRRARGDGQRHDARRVLRGVPAPPRVGGAARPARDAGAARALGRPRARRVRPAAGDAHRARAEHRLRGRLGREQRAAVVAAVAGEARPRGDVGGDAAPASPGGGARRVDVAPAAPAGRARPRPRHRRRVHGRRHPRLPPGLRGGQAPRHQRLRHRRALRVRVRRCRRRRRRPPAAARHRATAPRPPTGRTYLRRALGGGGGGGVGAGSSRSSVGSSAANRAGGGRPASVHSLGASSARTGSVLVRARHRRSGSVATTATTATPTAASFATATGSPAPSSPAAPGPPTQPPGEELIERWREDVDAREGSVRTATTAGGGDEDGAPATRASTAANPLRLEGSQSFMFWNLSQYEDRPGRPAAAEDDDERTQSREQNGREEERRCPRCGGTSVREKEARSWGFAKTKSLVCGECGLEKKG